MSAEYLLPPPTCLEDLQPCETCPYVALQDDSCPVLEFATAQTTLNILTAGLMEEDSLRIETLANDELLGIPSPRGLYDRIAHDQDLNNELSGDNWGVLIIDIRFLKYLNDKQSRQAGDDFLQDARDTIVDLITGDTRHELDSQPEDERRQDPQLTADTLWRFGGDEFGLLVTGTNRDGLETVRQRLAQAFGVSTNLTDESGSQYPMIASVGSAHAQDLGFDWFVPTATEEQRLEHIKDRLAKLGNMADAGHQAEKERQYDEMWRYVVSQDATGTRLAMGRPADSRQIAELFIECMQRSDLDTDPPTDELPPVV